MKIELKKIPIIKELLSGKIVEEKIDLPKKTVQLKRRGCYCVKKH